MAHLKQVGDDLLREGVDQLVRVRGCCCRAAQVDVSMPGAAARALARELPEALDGAQEPLWFEVPCPRFSVSLVEAGRERRPLGSHLFQAVLREALQFGKLPG